MVYKIVLLSDEIDNFKRVITIDSEATFLDLHNIILDSVGYTKDQPASFFICDEEWTKLQEVTLVEMDTSSEVDSYIMGEVRLNEFLEDEEQKFMYVFEYLTDRAFFMELYEVIPGKNQDQPLCIKSEGEAPAQFTNMDDFDKMLNQTAGLGLDENFYGDSDYDPDELDADGFDGLDNIADNSYSEY